MPPPATLAAVYCTDEDIAVRASDDFATLCPDWQLTAAGTDGAFATTDLWTLTSATTNFAGAGVGPNAVIVLSKPKASFPGGGALFACESATSGSVTLRRIGKPLGWGQPPAPAAGLTAVEFTIKTFGPQIDNASFDANKYCGIDPNLAQRAPALLYDPRDLRQFTVLSVLIERYADAMRGDDRGDWATKFRLYSAELSDLKARLQLKWGNLGENDLPKSAFSTQTRR